MFIYTRSDAFLEHVVATMGIHAENDTRQKYIKVPRNCE